MEPSETRVHAGTAPFGVLLRRYRLAASLSQEALASRAGLSATAIAALERGRRASPRSSTLTMLADALSLSGGDRAALIAAATAGPVPDEAAPTMAPIEPAVSDVAWRIQFAGTALLVGREREEAAVQHLLARPSGPGTARLLTLTGPGGVGKTSLALAVASRLREDYADGVAFIDLAPLSDPDLVMSTIARVVGGRQAGGREVDALLQEHLKSRQMLLVLDNFEQVLDAAPRVAALVGACPRLAILVTSRAALRVRAEQQFRVPPLSVPSPSRRASVDALAALAAVRLFAIRAQAIKPEFHLTPEHARTVAQICYRLDGLPLAIELAAARISLLPPQAILDRLERRLALLTAGPRDLPARQRTLRATIEWSYDLVPPDEQRLFRRLGVFAGGCTTAAAGAVCGVDSGEIDVLEGLATLVDYSLLRQDMVAGGETEPRVGMLETLREFACERLNESGEAEAIRRAHASNYLALAEQAEPELYGAAKSTWIARLSHDHDNLRAVLEWAVRPGDSTTADERMMVGLRMAAALWRFWQIQGYLAEGHGWLEQLLALLPAAICPPSVRARVLTGAAWLAHSVDNFERASALFQESIALRRSLGLPDGLTDLLVNQALESRAVGDYARATALLEECLAYHRAAADRQSIGRGGIGLSLARLALVLSEQGEYERARVLYTECLALHRELGEPGGIAVAQLGLGDIGRASGDAAQVRRYCQECIAIFQDLGERWGIGFALNNLALATLGEGDLAGAEALAEEGVAVLRGLGNSSSLAEVLTTRAVIAAARGDNPAARALFAEAMALARAAGPRWLIAANLEGLAVVAQNEGQAVAALRLCGAAATLRAALGAPMPPSGRDRFERTCRLAQSALDAAAATAAWAAGAAAPLEACIDEALRA